MEKKETKSQLARVPAWGLSIITLFVSVIPLIIVNDPKSTSLDTIQIIGWIFNIFLVTVACFFICKAHPKSVWYTPVICNGVTIIGLIANIILTIAFTIVGQGYKTSEAEWIIIICSIILSVIGAIAGAKIGRQRVEQEK